MIGFQYLDECSSEAKLGDVKGIVFLGAYARQPISDLWEHGEAPASSLGATKPLQKRSGCTRRCASTQKHFSGLLLARKNCTEWTEFNHDRVQLCEALLPSGIC
ncbi:hypothetical protein Y032_0025g1239 [Ancylostoma ceylanicum]|uniref:Uncharacterized protein n=1 Tax=Ancylostoma ceylanicum TaxID=53326 RepID=A0A016UWS3_9BILA|nr:hypothetical protein Y032_0025g1239 [Ancylostoma ceylanicum]